MRDVRILQVLVEYCNGMVWYDDDSSQLRRKKIKKNRTKTKRGQDNKRIQAKNKTLL